MSRRVLQLNRIRVRERKALMEERTPRQLPMLRSECENGLRPCPFLSCRHHLAADVSQNGNVHFAFLLELFEGDSEEVGWRETCALDVADRGPAKLEEIAGILGVTRERIRQIEARALRKLERVKGYRQWSRPD